MPPKYKNRGLDEAYLKYRSKDNYEILKPSKGTAVKKLEDIYMNNVWNLYDKFKDVEKQLNNLASQNRDVSWLNGIQYSSSSSAFYWHSKQISGPPLCPIF